MKPFFSAFLEHKDFLPSRPWSVVPMSFPLPVITPPHYADTVEILFCDNVKGTACINSQSYPVCGKKIFFIPPKAIHSICYEKSDGYVLVVKFHPAFLNRYLNMDTCLQEYGTSLAFLNREYADYDKLLPQVLTLKDTDSILEGLDAIIAILRHMVMHSAKQPQISCPLPSGSDTMNLTINRIITWTEQHFNEKITLDDVAGEFKYNKTYFCGLFKEQTGISYLKYLNTLRISNACKLLKTGAGVSKICELCGFENESYFIQLFKKTIGLTPKQYQKQLK